MHSENSAFSLSCQPLPKACTTMEIQPFPFWCNFQKALSCIAKFSLFRCHVSHFQMLARLWKFSHFLFVWVPESSVMYSVNSAFSLSCQSLPNALTSMEFQPFPFSCNFLKAPSRTAKIQPFLLLCPHNNFHTPNLIKTNPSTLPFSKHN